MGCDTVTPPPQVLNPPALGLINPPLITIAHYLPPATMARYPNEGLAQEI